MNSFAIVCIIGFLISLTASIIWFKKRNIIESVIIGTVFYFFDYIFASMALFIIDYYSLFRASFGGMIIDIIILIMAILKRKKKGIRLKELFQCDLSLKNMLIPVIICLIAFPFVSVKNEIFGMGQDEGVYQIQAINFMYNNNSRQKDFEEYHLLETEEERNHFNDSIRKQLGGYDIPSADYPKTVYDRNISQVSGFIHGIPSYSSMLAMWGTLFGIENMIDIDTVFYICTIFLVYFICRNLKLKKASCICACILTALSPVILWVSKSSLTEIFIDVIITAFLYFITDDENSSEKWLSIIPVAVFGCYHVSIYTMIPVFMMIYGGMYFFTREKQYAVLLPSVILGYMISFFAMKQIQPVYTINNYRDLFVAGINVHNISKVIPAACIILTAISILFIFILSRTNKNFKPEEFNKKASENGIFKIFLILLMLVPTAFTIIKSFTKYSSWEEANHLALWGFIFNAGVFLVSFAIIYFVTYPKFFIQENSRLAIFIMFFYCIIIYSSFLRYEIQYYFYYARYLAPFVPVAIIFGVLTMDRAGRKFIYPLTLLSLALSFPYSKFLMTAKDDTRMEWDILEDTSDIINSKEDSCIIINKFYSPKLWLPLKQMTNADIYPLNEENENQFAEKLLKYKNVFYITNKKISSDEGFEIYYKNKINHSEDDGNNTGKNIPMPLKYMEVKDDIYIYSFEKYKFSYTAHDDYDRLYGFSALENDFCWSSEEQAEISVNLYPDDYNAVISFGAVIPFEYISNDSVPISVYINNTEVYSSVINSGNCNDDISFSIPEEILKDGKNTIRIKSDLWKASELNSSDGRILGIPFKSIVFSES